MNKLLSLSSLSIVLIFINASFGYSVVELFRDNFDGNSLDLEKWQYRDANNNIILGITQFRGCPVVNGGMLTIAHHTYSPSSDSVRV